MEVPEIINSRDIVNNRNEANETIAILGTRGLPANYGGFETFAEELSLLLVKKGYRVIVFGRKGFGVPEQQSEHNGVSLRQSSTIFHKYLETPLATLTSIFLVNPRSCRNVILCNAANSPFAWILRLRGVKVYINVDGIERRRSKWNVIGKLWYRLGEISSVIFATKMIADADVIAEYYRDTYNAFPAVLAYGARERVERGSEILNDAKLSPGSYILYVARLEPENNALLVIQAHSKLKIRVPLVIVGDAPYATHYKASLYAAAGEDVHFLGYQFGPHYHELRKHCLIYVQATEVGGTHPALIEAMVYGNPIIANGTPENLEVLGGAGIYYRRNDVDDLARQLEYFIENPVVRSDYSRLAEERASQKYAWEKIAEQYEALLGFR